MDALKRIDRLCLTLTVAIYAVAQPFIEQISHFPWIPQTFTKSLLAFIASVGGYSLIVKALPALADSWKPLKKFFIGPSYVEGTWAGTALGSDGSERKIVIVLEQDNFSVNARGYEPDEKEKLGAIWHAPIVFIDQRAGTMRFLSWTDAMTTGREHSLAVWSVQFVRPNASTAPDGLIGKAAGADGCESSVTLKKESDERRDIGIPNRH